MSWAQYVPSGLASFLGSKVKQAKKVGEFNFAQLPWLETDKILFDEHKYCWQMPSIHLNSLAFLQYTSGSTGFAKRCHGFSW